MVLYNLNIFYISEIIKIIIINKYYNNLLVEYFNIKKLYQFIIKNRNYFYY